MITIESNADEFAKELKELEQKITELVGKAEVQSAGLLSKPRQGKGFSNNVDVMNKLIKDGRDFFTLNETESKQVIQAGEKELEKRASAALKKGRTLKTNAIWTGVYRVMCKEWMKIVQKKIESQTTISGSPTPLNPEYFEEKMALYGYDTIGVATKYLLDNFNPSLESRNIEIKLR